MVKRIVGGAILAVVTALVVQSFPDMLRYLKMRAM